LSPTRPVNELSFGERLNFLMTNRIPRHTLTRLMGWYSRIRSPWLTRLSIAVWQLFADDLRLFEAKQRRFSSLHDCFVRELRDDARVVDPDPTVIVSPCDAVLGAFGDADGLRVFQAKGFPYTLDELTGCPAVAERYRNGRFVTLRLKSSMYHRFHAPLAGRAREVTYISGDTWNVNPPALKAVDRLFCRNERVVLEIEAGAERILLVPVAAVLVASISLRGLPAPLTLDYRGPNRIPWQQQFEKGDELGYFAHGSTIVLFTDRTFHFDDALMTGSVIRMGQRLLQHVEAAQACSGTDIRTP
jgi:phosphatidylserine decarboxylase